jgi:hypothetical protein
MDLDGGLIINSELKMVGWRKSVAVQTLQIRFPSRCDFIRVPNTKEALDIEQKTEASLQNH